ncbi:patatin-like phospholipase family protein [Ideonella sp. DXS29W]|uniref:Patatin-like phospholipase family protein n=1 Tax=Ideonella lacteola TaxID=2984193 RepID=A0ABU9BPJ1_9BURK
MAAKPRARSTATPAPSSPTRRPSSRRGQRPFADRPIDIALQGGGSHGAFTWGVLDALLEDPRLVPDGISGTSAGAMNAAVLASGYAQGGRTGARENLSAFWRALGGITDCWAPAPGSLPPPGAVSDATTPPAWAFNRDQWPGYALWESWLRLWSPYQLNPFNLSPLRDLVRRHVDEDALRRGPVKVYVTATSVRTGQPRVFSGAELSIDALMASACLPQSAQAVTIDGEPYWDGGFSGNPALWPLIYDTPTHDLLLVQINPLRRENTPVTAADISDRINEITFNASLVAEMRAIAFVQKLLRQRQVDPTRYKDLRLHRIADESGLAPYNASSKLNTDPRLLQALFSIGRGAGERWLAEHADAVGLRSTVDIDKVFLQPR